MESGVISTSLSTSNVLEPDAIRYLKASTEIEIARTSTIRGAYNSSQALEHDETTQ